MIAEDIIITRIYVRDLIMSLPVSMQRLIKAYYWMGYTQQEIAEKAMQRNRYRHGRAITRSMVSKRLTKALLMLRRMICSENN